MNGPGSSRAATNALLARLRADGFRPAGIAAFLSAATRRSVEQAAARPRAVAEASALHVVLAVAAGGRHRGWLAISWLLTVTHLGMLENRTSLGLPNVLTILRGNLPVIEARLGRFTVPFAVATDLADGRLARRTGWATPFGGAADFLADAVVWNRLTFRAGAPGALRILSLAAWALPIAAITTASIAAGTMRELPRSRWLRPAAVAEAVIAVHLIRLPRKRVRTHRPG